MGSAAHTLCRVTQPGFHIPSLNGVRALAVVVVFVGHGTTVGGWWPGHAGVTIFFFLSGYLIVTLLRRERERTGSIALGKFYLRRLLRIQPPALVAIALATLLGSVGLLHPQADGWGVLAGVLNYTNYYIVVHGREGLPPDMSQLWSLGVEEHYYLIVPLLLLLLLARASRRTVGWTLVGFAALIPVWRVFLGLSGASFDRLYVSTDTRIDSLLVGSAMALLANPALGDRLPGGARTERSMTWLPGVAAVVFVASAVVPIQAFRLSVADCVQYVCLVPIFWFLITRADSTVGRLLNSRAVAYVGVLSYSVYLVHRMAISLVEQVVLVPVGTDVIAFVATLAVSMMIRVAVERPCERLRRSLEARVPTPSPAI